MRFKKLIAALAVVVGAACMDTSSSQTPLSGKGDDAPMGSVNCTLTQGYWKNHPGAWPVLELELGGRTYGQDELLAILHEPVKGNGLVQLSHQLIAAKLNIAAGASDTEIASVIVQADLLIGSLVVPPVGDGRLPPRDTSALNDQLAAFNEGKVGPGHCDGGGGGGGGDDGDGGDCDADHGCDGGGDDGGDCDSDHGCDGGGDDGGDCDHGCDGGGDDCDHDHGCDGDDKGGDEPCSDCGCP
jgi:hypothetical protein